ncbi:MAG: hypothetical protein JWM99_3019 [Verrucomicrobiales bacterium]|jgi:hypothetical protein|nr:hypothetical protein [Verrucomicrobiales bacterium]
MRNKKVDQLVLELENYLECWKQFAHYLNLARAKKFDADDESQFLEIKSVITQQLELILSSIASGAPSREDIHTMISNAPSIRFLSELNEGTLRGIENNWHKIYIAWQSMLGQLKVQQRDLESKGMFSSILGRK